MARVLTEDDHIDFGPLPAGIDALLQQGVSAYGDDKDPAEADRLFRAALEQAPNALPVYFCLYKIHGYQGHHDRARQAALGGLEEAARQAGLPTDWRQWRAEMFPTAADGPARFAKYTLKALAFLALRSGEHDHATTLLAKLRDIDPADGVGGSVIEALAAGL